MRRSLCSLALCAALAGDASAQVAVIDPAVLLKHMAIATTTQLLLNTQGDQRRQLGRMARRLSLYTDLRKYAVPDPPRWRTHGGHFLYTDEYNNALIFGDPAGAAFLAISHPVVDARSLLPSVAPTGRRVLTSRLATLNAADAATIAATHDTGVLRLNGRKQELPAIDVLEAHVIDPSNQQSATAVLDKISGAVLIGARQRQARIQLLAGVVEQLLIDTKRARDADVAAMNMQLVNWRDGRGANDAFVAGSGDALRTWRQP